MIKNPSPISIILLAAGASSRMKGRDKLLETIDGIPLLKRIEQVCLESKAMETLVILAPEKTQRAEVLGESVTKVFNSNWQQGMSNSLQCGLKNIHPNSKAAMVILADMPDITSQHLDQVIEFYTKAPPESIIRATSQSGTPGHPVIFDRTYFPELAEITGDIGARDVLIRHATAVRTIALPGNVAITDLNSPDDWSRYNALL